MFTFRRPTDDDVSELLSRQPDQPWSYPFIGATRERPPPDLPGWQVDRHRVLLGHGKAAFAAAGEAIRGWRMFPAEMTRVYGSESPPQPGQVVAVLYRARLVPIWMLFPARVVYVVAERRRFGFAYGTVPEHPERGEERFLIEWNPEDDSVWYELLAVSQPGHWLARAAYPYARYEQARFRRLSGQAMQRAVHERLRGEAPAVEPCGAMHHG
jgi:uncharacterized protein (UPF0548 family)